MAELPSNTTHFEPSDVTARLGELGLKAADLTDAAKYGMRHALQCTLHDPRSLPGIIAWGKTIRWLRDRLVPLGWEPNNARNYATVVKPDKSVALAAAAGDAWTGKHGPNQTPSTRSAKGPATRDAVALNQQLHFADISESFPAVVSVEGIETWLLLYFWDEENEEIRVELSLPANMTEQGHVTDWHERIILDAVPLSAPPALQGESDADETDINIEHIG